jgi:hypothetical protein
MLPTDPIQVTPVAAPGPLVRLSGHPDTLAAFVEHFHSDLDHSFPSDSYGRPSLCSAWPTSIHSSRDDLLEAIRRTSDLARIDIVIESDGETLPGIAAAAEWVDDEPTQPYTAADLAAMEAEWPCTIVGATVADMVECSNCRDRYSRGVRHACVLNAGTGGPSNAT